jgi:23S rRNA (adenine2503-C2)-methyltransferase
VHIYDVNMELISFLSCTQSEYVEKVDLFLGKGKRHAERLYSEGFRKGILDPDASWVEPQARKLVQEICKATDLCLPEISYIKEEGDVSKFLLKYTDGLESESVCIPMKFGKTICVSSQVGCRMGCAFCETGRMGLVRHLSSAEIVSQVFVAKHILKEELRNIVFMGMGEPFDNYEAIMRAISVLTCPTGLGFAPSKITVSTSGKVFEIDRFAQEADPALNLAISLNAPNDHIRSKLMPVNKQWDLAALRKAMERYLEHPRRKILIEYVLLEGINDSVEAAREVADYLQGLRVKINLIPYNAQSKSRLNPPTEKAMQEFRRILQEKGYQTLLRKTKGSSIMAACGQLGNLEVKKKLGAKSSLSLL